MKIRFSGFDWNEGNRAKCRKHGLGEQLIERFFLEAKILTTPDAKHSAVEQRFIAVGRMANGRPAFVAFTLRDGRIRPISARYMHGKEVRRYEEEIDPALEDR
jgi:hypothetical protein